MTATVSTQNTAAPWQQRDLIGHEIAGRIRILAKLGEGGMGTVYRGEQLSLKRTVAVKVLRPELSANQQLQRRFETEAQAIARLQHPNIVQVFDYGQDTDGSLFIAMEDIDGQSLRAVLAAEAPLDPARALSIAQQISASLIEAHAHGIVHRDLKPDNVMLQHRGRQRDVARVLDFGIAKLRDASRETQATMTHAGDMLGTPQYMAPEQIRGDAIDGRCDIYALGCLIYEMVTGRPPFEAPTVVAMLSKHLTEHPIPPSQRRPDLGLPAGIDQVVLAAMAKEPNQRPATMEQYADMLAGVMQTLPPGPSSRASAPAPASFAQQPTPTSWPFAPPQIQPTMFASQHPKKSRKLPLVLGALAFSAVSLGVCVATRNSTSSTDHRDYYKASVDDPGERTAPMPTPPSSDPRGSESRSTTPAPDPDPDPDPEPESDAAPAPAPKPAPAPAPKPAPTPRATVKHNYTCDQLGNKAVGFAERAVAQYLKDHAAEVAKATKEERQLIATRYQKEARALYALVVQECNSKDWPDTKRACFMNATSPYERCE